MRSVLYLLLSPFLLLYFSVSIVHARGSSTPAIDLSRAQLSDTTLFVPFSVTTTKPLKQVLAGQELKEAEKTELLVFNTPSGQPMALLTAQMAHHHVAQGINGDKPWMATFCVVCNSSVGFVPAVDSARLTFEVAGIYDGLPLLRDHETNSLWSHVTGECVSGKLKGKQLVAFNVLNMNVSEALEIYPDIEIAISDARLWPKTFSPFLQNPDTQKVTQVFEGFMRGSMGKEDTRRPTLDLGLGVWTGNGQRYYPLDILKSNGNAIIDTLDGATLVLYLDPVTGAPAALFANAASARWQGDDLMLSNGSVVHSGILLDEHGRRLSMNRPMQMFTRWYGFAYSFPGCELYSEDDEGSMAD